MVRIRLPPGESPQTIGSAGDFTRLIPIIQNHAGSIVKFLGDGVIATFGVARPSPTYAADATVALDEALAEIDRWNAHRHAAGLDCGERGRRVRTSRYGQYGPQGPPQ
jgi:class 3 adenylate cyclase